MLSDLKTAFLAYGVSADKGTALGQPLPPWNNSIYCKNSSLDVSPLLGQHYGIGFLKDAPCETTAFMPKLFPALVFCHLGNKQPSKPGESKRPIFIAPKE